MRILATVIVSLTAAASLGWADAASQGTGSCAYDRAAMMALDYEAFDQNPEGGWRALAKKPGCEAAAADLIRDYRTEKPSSNLLLFWHEGQVRAGVGQTEQAIALFQRSRHGGDSPGWNSYVDATIAFLKNDRAGLEAARRRLLTVGPRPPELAELEAELALKGRSPSWPPNIDEVDGFLACFGKPYREAYGGACRSKPAAAKP